MDNIKNLKPEGIQILERMLSIVKAIEQKRITAAFKPDYDI
jgi:hypothetical protein